MAFISSGEISKETGIDGHAVVIEVDRLVDAGYSPGSLQKMMTGGDPSSWYLTKSGLTERGARATSLWPRAQQLVEVIEARAQAEADPAARRPSRSF
jgi:hypothetical protein